MSLDPVLSSQETNIVVQATPAPPLVTVKYNPWPDRLLGAYVGGAAVGIVAHDFLQKHADNGDEVINPIRDSGRYKGVTAESDGVVQQVTVNLKFYNNGSIEGSGEDEEDGRYKISNGSWNADRVQWTEVYKDFSVKVHGQIRRRNDYLYLDCRFVSSIDNISGTFELTKV